MGYYVQVSEEEGEEPIELPLEDDNTLLLTTLTAQFPGTSGLKFRSESNTFRGVRLVDGRFHPPDNSWGNFVYYCVFCVKENKRKSDDSNENLVAKTKRMDISRCTDLIVLGLPWDLRESELKSYFQGFGDLLMAMIKKDTKTGKSKGYGFIRFASYESQIRVLSTRHKIENRVVTVKIPNSQESITPSSKVFVGRVTEDMSSEDLSNYFSKFGEVIDVFIPRPFRAFAFVTFLDSNVAQGILGEDHIIKGVSVHIGEASPKPFLGKSGSSDGHSEGNYPMPRHSNRNYNEGHNAPSNNAGHYNNNWSNSGPGSGSKEMLPFNKPPPNYPPGLFNTLGISPSLLAALSHASWEWMQQQQCSVPPSSPINNIPGYVNPPKASPSRSQGYNNYSSGPHRDNWWANGNGYQGGHKGSGNYNKSNNNSNNGDYFSRRERGSGGGGSYM